MTGRIPAFTGILIIVLGWWFVAVVEWRGEVSARNILTGKQSREQAAMFPLSAEPTRAAATRMLVSRSSEHDELDLYLRQSVARRPLYAPYWQDRAKGAFATGDISSARRYTDKAVALWPNRPSLVWKAALLYTQLGDTERAFAALQSIIKNEPYNWYRPISIALRLDQDMEMALRRVLPAENFDRTKRDDILLRLIRTAQNQQQIELGIAGWNLLSPASKASADASGFFVEWMASEGMREESINGWLAYRDGGEEQGIDNPGLEEPVSGGLGWRVYEADGAVAKRSDARANSGNHSLHIGFSGTKNLYYRHLKQFVPVEPGDRYRLGFYWAGNNLTTRAGPFVNIQGVKGEPIARSERKWGSWGWEQVEIEFQVPDNVRMMEIIITRTRTDSLDNKAGGDLWLDDFTLTRIEQ